jgi:hypothetical protein
MSAWDHPSEQVTIMVYLIANSPAGGGAQLVQTDARTARADPQFHYRGEERAAQRALIERCAPDMDRSILALDGHRAQIKAIQKQFGVEGHVASAILTEVKYSSRSDQSTWIRPEFASPVQAAQWGQDAMATLKDLVSAYNNSARLDKAADQSAAAQRDAALKSFKARGYSEEEAKDAAEKSVQHYKNARRDALEALRGSVNSQLLLINDLFDIAGPLVTLRDDGTLGFGDAVASWSGKGGSLALVAGNAQASENTATRIEPFDGTVREQSDPPAISTPRPEDAPGVGGFVNMRA